MSLKSGWRDICKGSEGESVVSRNAAENEPRPPGGSRVPVLGRNQSQRSRTSTLGCGQVPLHLPRGKLGSRLGLRSTWSKSSEASGAGGGRWAHLAAGR